MGKTQVNTFLAGLSKAPGKSPILASGSPQKYPESFKSASASLPALCGFEHRGLCILSFASLWPKMDECFPLLNGPYLKFICPCFKALKAFACAKRLIWECVSLSCLQVTWYGPRFEAEAKRKLRVQCSKRERQCFIGISKQREESWNTTRSGVFLSKGFGQPMKHCLERLIYLLNQN